MNPNIHILHTFIQAPERMRLYPAGAIEQTDAPIKVWLLTRAEYLNSDIWYSISAILL